MISQKSLFLTITFFNLNISKTMAYTEFKFCVLIPYMHAEGTVSQIFHLGLSFDFMKKIGKLFAKCLIIF